jgi:uncharacterized hydrophobic protein (TIGR00271 family)
MDRYPDTAGSALRNLTWPGRMAESNEVAEIVEEAASEQLGVGDWDRPAIYNEAASAATDNRLPYWAVLALSGGIATLGLALNSSAVVIGAMLVAPLLAPVMGLALALAVGDVRLSVQTMAVVLGSTITVIAVAALLTVLLPFHTITVEILARTRPTTLDLAIAVFSGLVSAVVTVARGSRLSAAIPGVAISVALIPPLAVAGFGIGVGRFDLIRGSLLLYGANLAGIVLSGMAVFLLIGMHRTEVLESARRWHREGTQHGLTKWADRMGWVRSLGVFQSPWARMGLVLAFAVALGLPLSETLSQIARETRVERAVVSAERELFDVPGRSSILGRQIVFRGDGIRVFLRVATTQWFSPATQEQFELEASAAAGEPVRLALEQLPARGEDLEQLREMFGDRDVRSTAAAPAAPIGLAELMASARERLTDAARALALPVDARVLQTDVGTTDAGTVVVGLAYAAAEPLGDQAEEMLRAQLLRLLDLAAFDLRLRHVSLSPRALYAPDDTIAITEIATVLQGFPALHLDIFGPEAGGGWQTEYAAARLRNAGVSGDRIDVRAAEGPVRAQLRLPE